MKRKCCFVSSLRFSTHKCEMNCLHMLIVVPVLHHVYGGEHAKQSIAWSIAPGGTYPRHMVGDQMRSPPASKHSETASRRSILSYILNRSISIYCTLIR